MYKYLIVAVLVSGCSTFGTSRINESDMSLIKDAVVVSTIADNLHCAYIGLTIFNNTNDLIPLDKSLDTTFSHNLSSKLTKFGIAARAEKSDAIRYTNREIGPSKWANMNINLSPEIAAKATTLVILDGQYDFNSRVGYYAKHNGLKTSASVYVYDLTTGRLLGKGSANRYFPEGNFSCEKTYVHPLDHLTNLIKRSADEIGTEVVDALFTK